MGKRAGCFAGFYRRINPALGEERRRQFTHARIEGVVGVHDDLLSLAPVDQTRVFHGQWCIAVPDLHLVEPQPFALELVIAVRQLRIGLNHRIA